MFTTVTSTEKFENITPAALYDLYMNADKVATYTGAPAISDNKVGGSFVHYDGLLTGTHLHLIPGELIVQTWRGAGFIFHDSILVLRLEAVGEHTFMYMTHCNVTPEQTLELAANWRLFLWDKIRAHLAGVPIVHVAPPAPAM